MTVFSSVTATLSPELASCMKAKGRTWKDAFFDSLKTLVGVDYTVYRKENQWQIKGEWNAVKKAYNILAKVAVIEKDAIAAYQAGEEDRAGKGSSPGGERAEAAGPRRRGRPPKLKPLISNYDKKGIIEDVLPPKRKRGRPRKVKTEEVKEDSDVEMKMMMMDKWDGEEKECLISQKSESVTLDCEKIENESVATDVTTAPAKDAETVLSDDVQISGVNDQLQSDGTLVSESSKTAFNTEQLSIAEHFIGEGRVAPLDQKEQVSEQDLNVSIHKEGQPRSEEGDPTSGCLQLPALPQSLGQAENEANPQENTSVSIADTGVLNNQSSPPSTSAMTPGEDINAKPNDLSQSLSEVVMAVAQEAIACSSTGENTDINSHHLASPVIQQRNIQTDNVETSHIFNYLGIKQKAAIDDFVDENDKSSSEQSKKLEELIEKMIEKMDKTLTEVPKVKSISSLKYICTECPYTSSKKAELREHMRNTHKDVDEPATEPTGPTAASPAEIRLSERRRLGPRRLHRCIECNYSSNSRKHLKEHKMRKHREKTLECDICCKKFAVSRDLSRHMKEHEGGSNRFTCEFCGKVYKQHYVLKRHQETHKDGYVKPVYPCDLCSKTFAAKQVLQIHVNAVHLGKKLSYPCETCNKNFTTKHSLAEHQLIHTNTKPYKCGICNKSFRHESTLKTHERLHTDNTQQFTCEYCGKAFRLRSSLRIHRNIHTGDKRFECPVCQKVFTQKQSLLRHARIHTGEKPFQCEICGSAFYDYSILRRHVTGVHKMQWKSPTQHYVLPPDSYKDGKVIDTPQEPSVVPLLPPKPRVMAQEVESITVNLMGQMAPPPPPPAPSQVYQAPPVSHTPLTLPQPAHTTHAPLTTHTLPTHNLQSSKPPSLPTQTAVKMTTIADPQELSSYHISVINQNIYQPQHVPLPNALPGNLAISQATTAPPQPAPAPLPPVTHHQQTMASPSPHPMSPLTTMTPAQYQPTVTQSSATPLSLQSGSYSLSQHLYYQSHH